MSKCVRCGKTVYFAERTLHEGKEYHQLCLGALHKEEGSIHNKGWYGTTPQDKEVVFRVVKEQPREGFCSQCGGSLKPNSKFCSSCGSKTE